MRIALGIEYDGIGFRGWQRQQPGVRSVQQHLEEALSHVADHAVEVVCAGRTDAGVHATAQIVHFDTEAVRPDKAWLLGVNTALPSDVRVLWKQETSGDFHARFSATARSYRYVILNRPMGSALDRHRACWQYHPLDQAAMGEAAQHLLGEHDFTSYRAAQCQAKHARRCVENIDVSRDGDYVFVDITANAFLHHMVRNIVGVLMAIGRGEHDTAWTQELLALEDRTVGGVTAPSCGLYLVAVRYPAQFGINGGGRVPRFA